MTEEAMVDFEEKKGRLRAYLSQNGYGAAVLSRRDTFAWFSCGGDSKILRNIETGIGTFLVTLREVYLIAETMNIGFLMDDFLLDADIQPIPTKWFDPPETEVAVKLAGGGKIVSDTACSGCDCKMHELQMLQFPLTEREIEICKDNCHTINDMLKDIADNVRPGMTEKQIEAEVQYAYTKESFECAVLLIGSDERITKYRHPIPSGRQIHKTLLIHPAASRHGLFADITRMVSFGEPDKALTDKYDALCRLEAQTLSLCKPGVRFETILEARRKLYAELGFAGEYDNHYPGAVTGYFTASNKAILDNEAVREKQLFDWFITVTGAKVEELSLSAPEGAALLSSDTVWPTQRCSYGGCDYDLPAIYIR